MTLKSSAGFPEITGAVLVSKTSTDTTVYYNITNGEGTLRAMAIKNIHGSHDAFVQIFDRTLAIGAGATAPDMQIPAKADTLHVLYFTPGIKFTNGLSFYVSKGATGSAEAETNPTSGVAIHFFYNPV